MKIKRQKAMVNKFKINGFQLKVIALISMTVDHIAGVLFAIGEYNVFDVGTATDQMIYFYARAIGRIAFPLFAFLLVEGFVHTKNFKKYILRVFIFAIISQIPYNLAFGDTIFYMERFLPSFLFGNVLWTFFFGLIMMYLLEKVEKKGFNVFIRIILYFLVVGVFAIFGRILLIDRHEYGIITIGTFYLLRKIRINQALSALITLIPQQPFLAYASIPLIILYNGNKGKSSKFLFYIFYPLHLLILYLIREFVM